LNSLIKRKIKKCYWKLQQSAETIRGIVEPFPSMTWIVLITLQPLSRS
jgi:hypothetical protein